MLSITVIAVGNIKEDWMRKGIDEYRKRLRAYCKFSVVEIPEQRLAKNASDAQINQALVKEGEQILKKIPPRSTVVSLCIEGKQQSSEQLSENLQRFSYNSSSVVFIIGSSHGLTSVIKRNSDVMLSLSKMTFPHQLTRLVLAEQIYRALSITAGSKYHK